MSEPIESMRPSELEDHGDLGCNPTPNPTMGEIIGGLGVGLQPRSP